MTEIVRYQDPDSWVDMLGPVGDLAQKISGTEFVPRGLRSKPAAVAAAVLSGRELGLPPLTSLRAIHIIDGTPSLSAEMLFALVLNAGHQVQWLEATDQKATVRITRCDGLAEGTATYSMKDAQIAGLATKDNWRKHPRSMLRHRAMTEAVSMTCPDIALALPGTEVAPVEANPAPISTAHTGVTTVQVGRQPVDNGEPIPLGIIEVAENVHDTRGEPTRDPRVSREKVETYPSVTEQESAQETEPRNAVTNASPVPVTRPQMRKLQALLSEQERTTGERLDRAQRRELIATMAGIEDPTSLASANELTAEQASKAIDALTDLARITDTVPEVADDE